MEPKYVYVVEEYHYASGYSVVCVEETEEQAKAITFIKNGMGSNRLVNNFIYTKHKLGGTFKVSVEKV